MNNKMTNVVVGLIPRVNKRNELEYLMIRSTKNFGGFTGLLYPPGGHIETEENAEDALKREVFEELGIEILVINKLDESPGDIKNQITLWFLCSTLPHDTTLHIDRNEIAEAVWIPEKQILSNKDIFWPATYKFLSKYLSTKNSQHHSLPAH